MKNKKKNDVELYLISSVLTTGDVSTALQRGVKPEHFVTSEDEWRWIVTFYTKNGRSPSESAFTHRFPATELFDTNDVLHWSTTMIEEFRSRSLMRSMKEALVMVEEGSAPDDAAESIIKGWREAVIGSQGSDDDTEIIGGWHRSYAEAIERKRKVKETGYAGVPTGFDTIDEITGGLQPGWFVIVGGRLGAGKTMTMLRMAWQAVWKGHRVLYISLEQSSTQIAYRIHSFASHTVMSGKSSIDSMSLVKGKGFRSATYKEILERMATETKGKLWVNDTSRGGITPEILASLIADRAPDIVFVDYLTLMGASGQHREAHQRTAQISGQLKLLASQFGIPIVAGSQLNRSGTGGDPGNEHISGSDAVGQDADLVILVTNKSEHVKKLIVSKFRHGADGQYVYANYSPQNGVFDEVTTTQAERLIEDDKAED